MNDKADNTAEFDAARIRALGWRQGCVLPLEVVESLKNAGALKDLPGPADLYIVITHDCDLNSWKIENEPFVELLKAKYVGNGKVDGQFSFGKNPRRYQFRHAVKLYEISIHDRFVVDRRCLLMCSPDHDSQPNQDEIKKICLWVAKRYVRAGFPDAFNARWNPVRKELRELLRDGGDDLTGIYISVDEEELTSEQPYEIDILVTMKVEDYENSEPRKRAQGCFDMFIAKLDGCNGITVVNDRLVSEREISLDDLRLLKRWDYDELSLKEDDWETIAPTEY